MSAGSGNQPNLKSSVECKPYNDQHTINGKVDEWKEIRKNKHSTVQSKRKLNCAGQKNSYIPRRENRFELISNYPPHDTPQNCIHTESKSRHRLRIKAPDKHRIILMGDSQIRGPAVPDIRSGGCQKMPAGGRSKGKKYLQSHKSLLFSYYWGPNT